MLGSFFLITSGIIWECHSPRSISPTAWKSFVVVFTDRDTEVHQNMFHHLSFLLPSPVNVMNNCCLCSEPLYYSFRGFKSILSWQQRQNYKSTGLGEKRVFPAVGVGPMTITRPEMDVLETQGKDKFLTSTRDSGCLVSSRHVSQTWSQAFEQKGVFSQALAWAFREQNARGSCLPTCSIPMKAKSLILHAPENVVPVCCHSKSPVMCLHQMQDMQSPFLMKRRVPISLFLKIAIMTLLQPPMHSATVSKMCSDLMSAAPGATFLWGRAEQRKEAKSAQLWWLLSCPLAGHKSIKYPSLQWGRRVMKQLQEESKLEWGCQIRC